MQICITLLVVIGKLAVELKLLLVKRTPHQTKGTLRTWTSATRVSPYLKIPTKIPDELLSSGVCCTVLRFTWLGSQRQSAQSTKKKKKLPVNVWTESWHQRALLEMNREKSWKSFSWITAGNDNQNGQKNLARIRQMNGETHLQPYCPFTILSPFNELAKTIHAMWSGGSFLMYDFLFFFPRARAALRQVPECITVRVTMAPWKASCPGFWALCPNTSHSIHYDPITALLGFLRSYPEPANWRGSGMLGPCQNVAHSLGFIWLRQKSV